MIAAHDDELIPGGDEIREGLHDARVVSHDEPELGEAVVRRATEAVRELFLRRLGHELAGVGHHAHSGKIDEVAADDEPPGPLVDPVRSVPVEKRDKVAVARDARPRPSRRVRDRRTKPRSLPR